MANIVPSTRFQSWVTRLRMPWMSRIGQKIWGGFAAVLGDKTLDWGAAANLEHLPSYASDPSVVLIGSERQMDTKPGEAAADLAEREPFWLQIAKFYGRPLGTLLALHFSGFEGAVLVQQNGRAFQLTLPLPPFILGSEWDPTLNQVITQTAMLDVALHSSITPSRSIPAGTPWWTIDSDTDFCSRFQILFPSTSKPFYTTGRAVFTASSTATLTWSSPFPDTTYLMLPGAAVVTDGSGAVSVSADNATKTQAGVTIDATAAFTGWVDVLAWQVGANPFADLHPADLARLHGIVRKWRPAKATCVGVYVAAQGKFAAWPVGTMAQMLGVPSSIVSLAGPWS